MVLKLRKDQEPVVSWLIHKKNKHFLSCRLEFECTNNTTEYEALIQGLNKDIDFKVRNLKVYCDSEIIFK